MTRIAARSVLLLLLLPSAALGQRRAAGRVITVTGDVDPDSVGITLMHEHLASNLLVPDAGTGYKAGPSAVLRRFRGDWPVLSGCKVS
jgi:hypothetical protein